MDENVYAPPSANLVPEKSDFFKLATRKRRFSAAVIDSVIGLLIGLPLIYFSGGINAIKNDFGFMTSTGYLIGLVGIVAFILIHGRFLYTNGQTVGKKLLGIKIVTLDDERATIIRHILPRYGFTTIIAYIPIVSSILPFIDSLFIFNSQRRCLHDFIGRTKVIDIN